MSIAFLSLAEPAGRLLIGGVFVFAGWRNIRAFPILAGVIAARGLPFAPVLLRAAITLQLGAGALVIVGMWLMPAALALIAFLMAATYLFHNFWDHQGLDRTNRINGLASNVALVGSFLLVAAG